MTVLIEPRKIELLSAARRLHAHLEHLGIPQEYAEYPGAHDWDYWETHIQEAIRFHWRSLGSTYDATL